MADIAEIQLMKVSSFSDGTDTVKGIRGISYRYNPRPTVGVMLEGELGPSRLEEVESATPLWSGSLQMSGPNGASLVNTTIASATVQIRDVTTASGVKVLTITNMVIKDISTGANNTSIQGATHTWEATNVAITDAV